MNANSISTITYHEATRSDADDLLKHYLSVYEHLGWSKDFLQWYYYDNPAGQAQTWIAKDQEKIVSSFTALPHSMWVKGQRFTGWRMQDLLTQPDYSGFGIYHTLAGKVRRFLKNSEYPVSFAFPNEKSHRGFISSGWDVAFRIPLRILQKVDHRAHSDRQVDIAEIGEFGSETDEIWQSYSTQALFSVDRQADYLNWRYMRNPKAKYYPYVLTENGERLVLILKMYDRGDEGGRWTHICDLFYSKPDKALLSQALIATLRFANANDCVGISAWETGRQEVSDAMNDFHFELQEQLPRWLVLFTKGSDFGSEVLQPESWHLSMGDSDVY